MNKEKLIIKLTDAIDAGKDKEGKILQIPVFESIKMIEGELYGIIEGYTDPPVNLHVENTFKH